MTFTLFLELRLRESYSHKDASVKMFVRISRAGVEWISRAGVEWISRLWGWISRLAAWIA
jgi:hypothetical protein